MLLDGQVGVSVDSMRIRTLGPGDYFGELSALERVPRTATVTTDSDVRAVLIEPGLFAEAVTSHPRSLAAARFAAEGRYVRTAGGA